MRIFKWLLKLLSKLGRDTRGFSTTAAVGGFIAAVIIIIAGVNMVPIIATEVDTVIFTEATGWNFTGSSGAEAMLGLIPFVFIAGLLLAAVGVALAWARQSD